MHFRASQLRIVVVSFVTAILVGCQAPANGSDGLPTTDSPSADTLATGAQDTTYVASPATDGGDVLMPAIRQRILVREDSLWEEALRIHYNAIVFDGHIDTPSLMLDRGYDFTRRHPSHVAHVDLPRMYEGGLDAAFFAIYIGPRYGEGAGAMQRANAMIDVIKRQVAATDSAEIALTSQDVLRITREGRKAILMGLEGGHATGGSVERLEELYDRGVRYIGLTHINSNSFADASQAPPRWNGLNDTGRAFIRAMNRLGMIVDLSHTSDETFYDVLEVTEAPVILSHTSARALVDNVRNIDDDMLRALADNGGLIMINFFDPVVNSNLTDEVMEEVYRRTGGRVGRLHNLWDVVYQVRRERGITTATLDDVVDHIDHVAQLIGVEHVGLGSDFDGVFDLPAGLQDVTRLPWITYELLKRGYSEDDLYKILGGNAIRVMHDVERLGAAYRTGATLLPRN
jgi:membrane dipeptidase